jgi:hypothetical protein
MHRSNSVQALPGRQTTLETVRHRLKPSRQRSPGLGSDEAIRSCEYDESRYESRRFADGRRSGQIALCNMQ